MVVETLRLQNGTYRSAHIMRVAGRAGVILLTRVVAREDSKLTIKYVLPVHAILRNPIQKHNTTGMSIWFLSQTADWFQNGTYRSAHIMRVAGRAGVMLLTRLVTREDSKLTIKCVLPVHAILRNP